MVSLLRYVDVSLLSHFCTGIVEKAGEALELKMDAGYWIWNLEFGIWDLGLSIWN